MKTILFKNLSAAAFTLLTFLANSQTTAMNFSGVDCSGNNVDLFSDLDAGKAVMLIYYMPNCGSCPPVATKMQTMANNINSTHPGLVKAYAFPYQNSTTCAYSASWVTNNNLPLFQAMDSGATQVAYYGGFGMPTVVLLGGNNHDVLFVTQDFNTSDTTTMRDLILTNFTAGLPEQNLVQNFSAYPNPATDLVNISFEALQGADFTMQLTDLSGKIVQSFEREKLNKGLIEKHIDLSGLPVGTYLLNLQMSETLITEKIHVVR
jgi:hypothetical protein